MKNKKAYITVFTLVATELIGFGLIIPVLPQITQKFTASGFLIGVLLSTYSFTQFLAAPILGQLSDKYGRVPILMLSKIGTIVSYLILANAQTFGWLLFSRAIDGFTGGNIVVARAYLSDITEEKHRSKAMAIIGIAFGTGFIIGPAIGGICYGFSNNFSITGYIGAFLSFISLITTQLFLTEPKKKSMPESISLKKNFRKIPKTGISLLIISFVSMVIFSGFETSFSIYTEKKFGFNESENSTLFFLIGLVAFLIQGSFTRISIAPIKKAIHIALLSIGLGLILTNIIQSTIPSIIMLILLLFGISILNTHLPAELSTTTPNKGFILGIYDSVGSIARMIGPLLVFSSLFNVMDMIYIILGSLVILCLFLSYFFELPKL